MANKDQNSPSNNRLAKIIKTAIIAKTVIFATLIAASIMYKTIKKSN